MAALTPNDRKIILVTLEFFSCLLKTKLYISGTRAATYKLMEPYRARFYTSFIGPAIK